MSDINWRGAIARRTHLARCVAECEADGDRDRATAFRAELERTPHPGWLRTKKYSAWDLRRLARERPEWFQMEVNPWATEGTK